MALAAGPVPVVWYDINWIVTGIGRSPGDLAYPKAARRYQSPYHYYNCTITVRDEEDNAYNLPCNYVKVSISPEKVGVFWSLVGKADQVFSRFLGTDLGYVVSIVIAVLLSPVLLPFVMLVD